MTALSSPFHQLILTKMKETTTDDPWHTSNNPNITHRTHGDFLTKSTEGSDRIDPLFPLTSHCVSISLCGEEVCPADFEFFIEFFIVLVSLYFLHAHNSSSLLVLLVAVRFSYITATLSHHQEVGRGERCRFSPIYSKNIFLYRCCGVHLSFSSYPQYLPEPSYFLLT